jgi:outer membrane protein TolC
MNYKILVRICSLWCIFLSYHSTAQKNDKQILENQTLDLCISYALAHSNSLQNAKIDIEISQAKISETRSAGLPQINGQVDFFNNLALQKSFIRANQFEPLAPPNAVRSVAFQLPYSSVASINASQMLFNGSYLIGLKAAQVYAELAQKNVELSEIEIIANVSKAYYTCLINQERLTLLDQNVLRLEKLFEDTKIMLANGMIEKLDLDRIEVNLNNLKTERTKLLQLLDLSKAILKFQMNLQQTEL